MDHHFAPRMPSVSSPLREANADGYPAFVALFFGVTSLLSSVSRQLVHLSKSPLSLHAFAKM